MKKDRFLLGIIIGIILLVGATTILLFARQGNETYLADDAPEQVFHNFALALINEDYNKAYTYLADQEYKPTFVDFINFYADQTDSAPGFAIAIGDADTRAGETIVTYSMIRKGYSTAIARSHQYAILISQDGKWKVLDAGTYYFWDYEWYQEPYEYPEVY